MVKYGNPGKYEDYAKEKAPSKKAKHKEYTDEELNELMGFTVDATEGKRLRRVLAKAEEKAAREATERLTDLRQRRARAMMGRPRTAVGLGGGTDDGVWRQTVSAIGPTAIRGAQGTGAAQRETFSEADLGAAYQSLTGADGGFAEADAASLGITPSIDPWMTGQFTPGSADVKNPWGKSEGEVDKDVSKFEQQIQTFRDRLTEQAEETIAGIKEYRETGLQNLNRNKRILRDQYSRQDKLWADLTELSRESRIDNNTLLEEGYADEVDRTNAYLTSMGVKNPTVFTDKPKNATEAQVQATFLAGAETAREIDLTRQFARESLQNINMTGFSTAQSELVVNATQQLGDVAKWLKEGMWKIDDAVMEKEMTEEQAATDALELANYAHIISNELGTSLDTTFAAMKMGVLGKYMDHVWEPDEMYFPAAAWLGEGWPEDVKLPMDVILDIQKANLNKQEMEEAVLRMREIYG